MCESQTALNSTSDTDLPKFKLAGLRRGWSCWSPLL